MILCHYPLPDVMLLDNGVERIGLQGAGSFMMTLFY